MHNRLWLSLLLAVFISAGGCAKHEDTSSDADAISSPAQSVATPEPQPVAPAAAAGSVESDASKKPENLLKDNSAAPAKADARSNADTAEFEAAPAKAERKKEKGAAEEKASPSGDDMERMD